MHFDHFGLEEGILRAVRSAGYERPTPVQAAAIPKILRGDDLIAIAQTGTGKTAAFVLPMLHRLSASKRDRRILALILVPTRELAVQITDNIRAYGKHLLLRVATLHGGVDEAAQIKAVGKGTQIIVATPGRLLDLLGRRKLDFDALEMLVLDEADRMLHMGFLPDIETILGGLPGDRQTLMFSATFPREVESLARRFLRRPVRVQLGGRADAADTVRQSVYEVPRHLKGALLLELLRQPKFRRVLVFVRMKEGADRLATFLREAGVAVGRLHSSRSQEQRSRALNEFKEGQVQVLVATDIVARGIDIEGVTHVVNFDLPVNPEDYVHRIGRTGRAEASGDAISLVPRGDLNLLDLLELHLGERIERKRLRGFDYRATTPPGADVATNAKRDWRKRTRERESKGGDRESAKKKSGRKGSGA